MTLAQGPMEMQREGPPLQDVECQVRYPGRNDLKSSMAFLLLKFNFVFQAEEMFSAEVWLAGWSVGSIGRHLNAVYLKVRVYICYTRVTISEIWAAVTGAGPIQAWHLIKT